VIFIFNAKVVFSNENHDSEKHPLTSTVSCPQESDAEGRRYLTAGTMPSEVMFNELRHNLPGLKNLNNKQIMGMMKLMGPNYYWTFDKKNPDQKTGALILAHGFGEEGDLEFHNSMTDISSKHIECALFELRQSGAEKIYIVPIITTPHNTLAQQWEYILGLRNDHAYAKVKSFKSDDVIFLKPINDHQIAKQIVLDYTMEISVNPKNEAVVIIGHGPVREIDNQHELEIMENLAVYIRENGKFSVVKPFTLQDDAPKEIRDKNVNQIKQFMENATLDGKKVLMVSNLMSGKGIQKKIYKDFSGLEYEFNPKGFLTHPLFKEWILQSIESSDR
jgi:hypothetical protein